MLGEVFREHSRGVMCGLGAVITLTVTVYVLIGYLPTFAVNKRIHANSTGLLR
jgi:hypothetical protein